jgi:osmoprotectant transport system substrate-binding protein
MRTFIVAVALALGAALGSPAHAQVKVGSKIDTEGNLLGNMIKIVLQGANIPVTDRVGLGGTPVVRGAITSGEIDIYPEYTGNAAFFFNKAEGDVWKDLQKGYEEAKKLDYEANKIVWLQPAPANNTWAIALKKEMADRNRLKTMSDFGRYIAGGGQIKLAGCPEFVNSPAALPAFQKAYGFTLPQANMLVLAGCDTAATIKAAAEGTDGTNAAMVYGTDGAIAALGLVVMEDDKSVQPVYAPAPIVREAALKEHPQIETLLRPVFAALDLATLQELNGRVAIGGENAQAVAKDWLTRKGFAK